MAKHQELGSQTSAMAVLLQRQRRWGFSVLRWRLLGLVGLVGGLGALATRRPLGTILVADFFGDFFW